MKSNFFFTFICLFTLTNFAKFEELYPLLDQLIITSFAKLTEQEKIILAPYEYKKNLVAARAAMMHLASIIIQMYFEKNPLPELTSEELEQLTIQYNERITQKRESVFLGPEIEVIDEESAIRRATQRLTEAQLNCLQYLQFKENPYSSIYILQILADYVIEELTSHKILITIDISEYKPFFITNRFNSLKQMYSVEI